jgi:hypothetical protein
MSEVSRPPERPWSVPAAIIAWGAAALLGLSAGSNLDQRLQPALGPNGATAAGFAVALFVLVSVGTVGYRGLTR